GAVARGFTDLFPRDRALRRGKRHRICCARYFAARAIWPVTVSDADGTSGAPYSHIYGAVSVGRLNHFWSRRCELDSWAACARWSSKRIACQLALDVEPTTNRRGRYQLSAGACEPDFA